MQSRPPTLALPLLAALALGALAAAPSYGAVAIYVDDLVGYQADADALPDDVTGATGCSTVADPGLTHGQNLNNISLTAGGASFVLTEDRLTEGAAIPGTIGGFNGTASQFDYENPVDQNGQTSTNPDPDDWGFDTLGSDGDEQLAFIMDFTGSPGAVRAFSFEAQDMEVSDPSAHLAVYDPAGNLLGSQTFGAGSGNPADATANFTFGVTVDPNEEIGFVAIINGDDNNTGNNDPFAISFAGPGFTVCYVPEPAGLSLAALSLAALALRRRRR